MRTSILSLIITLVVGVILVGSLLSPAIDNAKSTENVEQIPGFTHLATTEFGHEYTFSNSSITCDGEELGLSVVNILSDKFKIIRYNGNTTMLDSLGSGAINITNLSVKTDGTYSYMDTSNTEHTSNTALTWFAGPAKTGDYVGLSTGSGQTIITNTDAKIYLTTNTNLTNEASQTLNNLSYILNASGTMANLEVSGYVKSGAEWTEALGSVDFPYSMDDDLYKYSTPSDIQFELNGYGNTANNAYIYAPYEYTVVQDNATNSLLAVIPVMIIIALLVSAVGMFTFRKD